MIDKEILNKSTLALDVKKLDDTIENSPTLPSKSEKENLPISNVTNSANLNIVAKTSITSKYDFNVVYEELHAKFPNIINMDKQASAFCNLASEKKC